MACSVCETKFVINDEYYTVGTTKLCKNCNIVSGLSAYSKLTVHTVFARSRKLRYSQVRRNAKSNVFDKLPKVRWEPCIKCQSPLYVGSKFVIVQKPDEQTIDKWQPEFSGLYGHRICCDCCRTLSKPKMPYETYELGTMIQKQTDKIDKNQYCILANPIAKKRRLVKF